MKAMPTEIAGHTHPGTDQDRELGREVAAGELEQGPTMTEVDGSNEMPLMASGLERNLRLLVDCLFLRILSSQICGV